MSFPVHALPLWVQVDPLGMEPSGPCWSLNTEHLLASLDLCAGCHCQGGDIFLESESQTPLKEHQ